MSTLGYFGKLYNGLRKRVAGGASRPCYLCVEPGLALGLCVDCLGALVVRRQKIVVSPGPFLAASIVPYEFRFPLDVIIRNAKFSGDMLALGLCGKLLARCVSTHLQDFDLMIPMPLSRQRYLARGYNQAAALAASIVQQADCRLANDVVRRSQHRPPQSTLPAALRAANVAGTFSCRKALSGERIVIVDDVVTTGATVTELARTLKARGAGQIVVVALAGATAHVS